MADEPLPSLFARKISADFGHRSTPSRPLLPIRLGRSSRGRSSRPAHHRWNDTNDTKLMKNNIGTIRVAARVPELRRAEQVRRGEYIMRKIKLVAVAAALIVAGVGAWVATTTEARVIAPIGARAAIDPLQMMMNARRLPTEEFIDYSFVFNH
jgi:hypothetical protein